MKTDSPPGGRLAPGGPRGYRDRSTREISGSLTHGRDTFTSAQALDLLASTILGVLRRGSGDAAHGTLGDRPLRRGYADAKLCRVRQEGIHFLNHPKDTSAVKGLEPPRGAQGKGCALEQDRLFALSSLHEQPTVDSIQLAKRIDSRWHTAALSPAAIQKLVNTYTARAVEDKLRELYGFPPEEALRSPYAYLETMLREGL